MERYYVPASIPFDDESVFSISWNGENYHVYSNCPDRANVGSTLAYVEISPWGFTRGVGFTNISNDSHFIVGVGCSVSDFDISQAEVSRSIFDAPNFSPFEPIYFLGFLLLGYFIFTFALKLLFGRGYK